MCTKISHVVTISACLAVVYNDHRRLEHHVCGGDVWETGTQGEGDRRNRESDVTTAMFKGSAEVVRTF